MKKLSLICLVISAIVLISNLAAQAQWVKSTLDYGGTVECFAVSGSDVFVGTFGSGIFHSKDDGTTWSLADTGLINTYVQAIAFSNTGLYVGTWGYGVFRSTNEGGSWTPVHNGLTNAIVLSIAASGNDIWAGTSGGGVFVSSDSGSNWGAINTGLVPYIGSAIYVPALITVRSNVFAGTYTGVYVSSDNSTSWTPAYNGLTQSFISAFLNTGTALFAGTSGGVFRSSDNGQNWSKTSQGLPDSYVFSLVVYGNNIFAGTMAGVFLSTDNGTNWEAVNTGLPQKTVMTVRALAVVGTNLYAGIDSAGVWRRPLSDMVTAVNDNDQLPAHMALEQNYPNPFNPTTVIRFDVPRPRFVSLKVYDVLGREVRILVNKLEQPGSYSFTFNAAGLSSGVYFYKLQAGSFSETKKCLLLK